MPGHPKRKLPPQPSFGQGLILVGLGNSDPAYADAYHNAGQLAAEYLKAHAPREVVRSGKKKGFAFTEFEDGTLLVIPDCAMNESGLPVLRALRAFGKKPRDLMLLHDDSDIALGSYKISFGSRAAGHRGVQSVIDALGTKYFFRIRIGIRPAKENRKALEFVLKKIRAAHMGILDGVFSQIAEALRTKKTA